MHTLNLKIIIDIPSLRKRIPGLQYCTVVVSALWSLGSLVYYSTVDVELLMRIKRNRKREVIILEMKATDSMDA